MARHFFRLFDASVRTERTRVATITRLKSGCWRVQVRRKGRYVNDTFLRRKDAEEWGINDQPARVDAATLLASGLLGQFRRYSGWDEWHGQYPNEHWLMDSVFRRAREPIPPADGRAPCSKSCPCPNAVACGNSVR
jgi:hypothetical protein